MIGSEVVGVGGTGSSGGKGSVAPGDVVRVDAAMKSAHGDNIETD